MDFTVLLLILLMNKLESLSAEDCTTGFSVVAPELAVPGKTTAILVTLHGPTSLRPINVTVKLVQDPSNEDSHQQPIEITKEIKGHGILLLEVPAEATGNFMLLTQVNCNATDVCTLQSSSQLRMVGPVRDIIIRPAKHAYRPGETVSFWVMALDHDLQIASDVIASISIKDPAGTKVAVWYQVPLDEGIKSFSLPISEYARIGRWLIHVEVESTEFSTPIEIAPGAGSGMQDVSAAEEHYVELRFGREMRRRYKPGLPFIGKVEAMSTEKSVRVRVKVYDNSTSIYSQDIEINAGEGTFVVPAIMADSDVIALQAELVSVEGKEIESHYVLAREPIYKWNSSSDCYLLIEGVEHTLKPEEVAHVIILSTCPCERDIHYVITTDGRVTDWAERRYEEETPITISTASSEICRFNFSFTVRSIMAPVSQLLVYYVTSQGEPVSDVISFDVKLLNSGVFVNLEDREYWQPGQSLDLEVVTESSSLACLLGGHSRGSGDVKFDPRISEEKEQNMVTGEVDFLEAGVSFFQRQCIKRGESGISAVSYRQRGSGAGPSSRRRPPESLVGGAPFDHLWLWKCFNYTSEVAAAGITISAPQEAGKWSLWVLTIGNGGLRFSAPVSIQVFRPLQTEFHLPPSLRVGETLEVDIKIANNLNSCMDVTALLALSEGAQFMSNGQLYVTERLRLGAQGATSLVVRVLVSTPGVKNMTVEVNGYSSPPCEGSQSLSPNSTLIGAVVRSSTIMVYSEGLVRTDTESAYFCANENMVISTSDNFKYEWIGAPRNRAGVVLEVKAGGSGIVTPVHIALAENRMLSDRMYRLTIGDAENTITWLGRGKHEYGIHLININTPEILSSDHWRTFWLTWEKNTLKFGTGSIPQNNTLLKWRMDKKIKMQQIGFASAWGNIAEFRVWNFNEESGFSQVLHLDMPKSLVPGSESGELLIAGGLTLPGAFKKYETGGLSGAIAYLAPIIQLKHMGIKANESEKKQFLENLPRYVQTILAYRKPDNSFSEHQMLGSHKSTLSILQTLVEMQSYFSIDPDLIQGAMRWVQLRQEDNGSFTPLPADVKISLRNISTQFPSLEEIVSLTAETLITFEKQSIETTEQIYGFGKAVNFLENVMEDIENPEALSAVTLALVLYKSKKANVAIEKLKNNSLSEDGEFGWPRSMPRRDAADWLYESESGQTFKEPVIATVEEYKASIYALWTFCIIQDFKFAESVARYLFYRSHMLDKHPELLYAAVKVFAEFDSRANDRQRSLTVSLATSGMELTDTLQITNDNSLQTLHLPSLPTKVFVYATGAGCATIQGKMKYSTYSVSNTTPLLELQSAVIDEILPEHSSVDEIEGKLPMLKIKHCIRWKGQLPSGVLRLEVELFSGFELASVTQILVSHTGSMAEMQHGYYANNMWFIFANISTTCPICVQYIVRSNYIISSLRPSFARVYPASREDLAAETFFHAKEHSNLLKGITEDDLITWFGKNSTHESENHFEISCECANNCSIAAQKHLSVNAFEVVHKVENLSISTYTINVDNASIHNLTEKSQGINIVQSATVSSIDNTTVLADNITNTVKKNDSFLNETKNPSKKKLINAKNAISKKPKNLKKIQDVVKNALKAAASQTMFPSTTTFPQISCNTESQELIVNTNVAPPKHVNTEKHELPVKYFQNSKMREGIEEEETKQKFAPEIKNDRYLLLDKEDLWGILREAVSEEVNKAKQKLKVTTA